MSYDDTFGTRKHPSKAFFPPKIWMSQVQTLQKKLSKKLHIENTASKNKLLLPTSVHTTYTMC